ncbi:MAG: phosphoribosylanthranilate isomerase [Pseudomonadota bacterium]
MEKAIKICGLKTEEALETALLCGATHIGLVFYPPSPRAVALVEAARLAAVVKARAQVVALVVDPDDALLAELVTTVTPDMFQLHGSESPARVAEIRKTFEVPVMKAIRIGSRADLAPVPDHARFADALLFDARPPKGEGLGLPGGNGVAFDWSLVAGLDIGVPIMLSGGLDANNVAEAVRETGITSVDVSSGVESAPGEKDKALIRAFIDAAKHAQREFQGVYV